jgi:hypothetical protein
MCAKSRIAESILLGEVTEVVESLIQLGRVKLPGHHTVAQGPTQEDEAQLAS